MGVRLESKGVVVELEVRFGNAAEEIIRFVDEMHVDVGAMSTHGRPGIGVGSLPVSRSNYSIREVPLFCLLFVW